MQPVLTVAEMNAIDAAAAESTPLDVLVGRAGQAVARAALDGAEPDIAAAFDGT